MRSFWSDPYLWIHVAGVAALPIFLEICFLGLAVGDPVLPMGLELLFVASVGIAPIVWMQWQRPFYIFSLVAIALKPTQLSVEQRKLLRLFKTQTNRLLAVGVPVVLLWVLWQLYRYAPIASEITPLPANARGLGLVVAAIAFLASNLFLQVPVSVASVLLTRETTFTTTDPYPVEQIPTDFTLLGWRVKQIVPDLTAAPPPKPAAQVETSPVTKPKVDSAPEGISATLTDLQLDVESEPDGVADALSEPESNTVSEVISEAISEPPEVISEPVPEEMVMSEVISDISDISEPPEVISEPVPEEMVMSEVISEPPEAESEPAPEEIVMSEPEAEPDVLAESMPESDPPTKE